jgi:hypothetical protein
MISTENEGFNELLQKAQLDCINIKEKFNYEEELKSLYAKTEEEIKKHNAEESEEFTCPLDDGTTIFKYKDSLLFYGKIEKDYYKEGVLMKKEAKGTGLYKGTFSNENEIESFDGVYIANKEPSSLYAIIGKICNDEVDGMLCYTDENGEINKLYFGKMKKGNPIGENVTITINKKQIILTEIKDDKQTIYHWESGKQFITFNEEITAIFSITDELIYMGKLAKNENLYEYSGHGIIIHKNNNYYIGNVQEGKRFGEGKFYVITEEPGLYYLIEGQFDDLKVHTATVTKYMKDEQAVKLFAGEIDGNIYIGKYSFSEKEYFDGEIENWQKKKGVYHYENGTKFEGTWEDDKVRKGRRIENDGSGEAVGE